jgi:gamma-glutamyl-gamma-aminobutyrate hydrolase PuuD
MKILSLLLFLLITALQNNHLYAENNTKQYQKTKIICITSRSDYYESEFKDQEDHSREFALFGARDSFANSIALYSQTYNIVPLILPHRNDLSEAMVTQYIDICDGLIIGGSSHVSAFNIKMLSNFLKTGKPVLAICLGQQILASLYKNPKLINVKENKDKWVDIDQYLVDTRTIKHSKIKHRANFNKPVHAIEIKRDSVLYKINNNETSAFVNSVHNFAINPETINGTKLKIAATSDDGAIEAIEDPTYPSFLLGVVFHPEAFYNEQNHTLDEKLPIYDSIFNTFLKSVATYNTCSKKN